MKSSLSFSLQRILAGIFAAGLIVLSGGLWAKAPVDPAARPPVAEVPETPLDAPAGTWTLGVLPDTQYYCRSFPEVFLRQTEWLVKNRERHNILFVAHEGDITGRNSPDNWKVARQAMSVLNKGGMPYALLPGNHDLGTKGKTDTRETYLNAYFTKADYKNSQAYGLFEPDKLENSWHELDTPTGKFLILALEFGPRDAVLEWANRVVAERPDRQVIVVTHSYLMDDSDLSDMERGERGQAGNPKKYGIKDDANDGADMWRKLISKHKNIRLVLNGHVCDKGVGYRESVGEAGQRVHQILANYQDNGGKGGTVYPRRGYGGGGYLRLLEFYPDGKTVRVRSYSPWYDHWLEEPEQQFVLQW